MNRRYWVIRDRNGAYWRETERGRHTWVLEPDKARRFATAREALREIEANSIPNAWMSTADLR